MAGFRVFGFSVAQVGFYLVQGRKITPGTFAFANVRVLEGRLRLQVRLRW